MEDCGASKPRVTFFICDGLHWAWECPKRKALIALVASTHDQDGGEMDEGAKMDSLHLLGAMQSAPKTPKGLMYVDATINEIAKALVDTGASHNFVSVEEAKRLGLKVVNGRGSFKAVNSTALPLQGVTCGVKVSLGAWTSQVDLSVAPMDDFSIVFDMEFLDKVRDFLMPCSNSMYIMDEPKACVVPTERTTKPMTQAFSALQLKKGLKRAEESYLTISKEYDEESPKPSLSTEGQIVLDKSYDVMLEALPKRLLPRREVNHKIELDLDTRLLTLSPYHVEKLEWCSENNVVVDALSRKAELIALSRPSSPLLDRIKKRLEHDALAQNLLVFIKEGKTRQFWLNDGLFYAKQNHMRSHVFPT